MTEGTNNNGGFTVPTTVNRDIVARRDDMSRTTRNILEAIAATLFIGAIAAAWSAARLGFFA